MMGKLENHPEEVGSSHSTAAGGLRGLALPTGVRRDYARPGLSANTHLFLGPALAPEGAQGCK